jgi:CRP/FNR family cyclic AMP-dependent transcriptional regulator
MLRGAGKFIQNFDDGQAVFVEGDEGSEMFVVLSGEVVISKQSDSQSIPLAVLREGEMFGEMALVASGIRSASAIAKGNGTKIVCIDQARFVYLVSQQPAFALSVMRMMAKRLAGATATTI